MKLIALLFALVPLLVAGRAESAPPRRPLYTIAVGHNRVAEVLRPNAAGLTTLRYADDDAIRLFNLMQHASRRAYLLAIADADSQQRFPEAARVALAPSLAELDRVVTLVSQAISRDRSVGEEPELIFFFSGHGVLDENGSAALSLVDGALTRSWLYERLLARVPARTHSSSHSSRSSAKVTSTPRRSSGSPTSARSSRRARGHRASSGTRIDPGCSRISFSRRSAARPT